MSTLYVPRSFRTNSLKSSMATSIITGEKWKHCDRSKALSASLTNSNSNLQVLEIAYIEDLRGLLVDKNHNILINSTDSEKLFGRYPAINLTSVDVGEIWILLRLLSLGKLDGLEFYYCSPTDYLGAGVGKKSIKTPLSSSSGNWSSLPGLTTEWNSDELQFKLISILGFDLYRLGSIDSYEGFPDSQEETLVLADPPTSPYWVERSLRENHHLIKRVLSKESKVEPILRVSGICPSTVSSVFTHMYKSIDERWCFIPLGPRIQTLGTLIFTSNQLNKDLKLEREPRIGILYDFPSPKPSSTTMKSKPENTWQFNIERM